MDFRPGTLDLWASSHGRDNLGDDLPPECFYLLERGKHYGWPYSYSHRGKVVRDPDLGHKGVRQTGHPALEYQAHSAPLGLRFYTGMAFPARYQRGFFTAFHGSWNRSVPTGYKVVFVPLVGRAAVGKPEDFLDGFLKDRSRFGRPVDIVTGPRGELFVSDDHGGRIFRVAYEGSGR
jgi:glucose/arabinose dehydrogenase